MFVVVAVPFAVVVNLGRVYRDEILSGFQRKSFLRQFVTSCCMALARAGWSSGVLVLEFDAAVGMMAAAPNYIQPERFGSLTRGAPGVFLDLARQHLASVRGIDRTNAGRDASCRGEADRRSVTSAGRAWVRRR